MRKIIIFLLVCLIFTPFHYLKIEQAKADEPDNFTFKWRINYGDYSSWAPPVVEDINSDGIYEIFLTAKYLPGGKAGIFSINGSNGDIIWQTNFTSLKDWHIPMAIGDLNNDGTYELVHAAGSKTIARNCEDGSIFWEVNTDSGWGSPAIADTDGTGIPYVFVGDNSGFDAPVTISKLYGNNGTLAAQSDAISYTCYGGVSIADLDRDGDYEIVMSDSGNSHCFDEDLNELWTTSSYTSESHCAILTNVTGDADLEVIILDQDMSAPYNGGIHVYYADGTEVPGMNDGTLGLGCHCQPAVHDIDQDGNVEVLTSYGGTDCTVWDLVNWEADALLEKGSEPPDIANVLGDSALEVVSPAAYVDGQVDIYDSSYDNIDTIGGYGNPIYGMNTVVQDIDNDGLNEIIISGPGEGNMTVYETLVTAPTPRVRTDTEYYSERRCNAGEYIPKIGPKCTLSNPSIPDSTSEISISTSTLEITINEPDNDPIDWSIETSPNIGKASGKEETNGIKTCSISSLQPDTTYTWYVNATDKTNWKCETYTFTTTSEGTSYYVSNDGDNSNDGTSPDEPWETISKVNSELANDNIGIGDDIYFRRGDTFYGEIDLRNGGTPDNYMIIGAYGTGTDPVIDNSIGMEDNCCIKIWYDVSGYYQIENLKVCNTTGSGDGIHIAPTANQNNHSDIIIRNIVAENINGREGIFISNVINYTIENIQTKGCTITLYGDEYESLSNGKVFNCTLDGEFNTYGLSIHRSDSAGENYDVGDFHWFKNITVYNNADEDNAIDITAGNNLLFEDCEVYNGEHIAFGIGHEVTNLTIQDCYVHDHNGEAFNIGTSNNLVIRNNIVYNVSGSLLKFETEDGSLWNREDGYTDNVTIYHNTFIQPNGWSGTNRLYASDYDYFKDTIIKNNIFASFDSTNPSALYRAYAAVLPPNNDLTFNSNMWHHGSDDSDNQWWNGESMLDLSEWQNYYPTEVFDNPELEDIYSYDFTLSSTSPCIDGGSFLTQTDGSGTGTSFKVDDSSYFMDGYGFITGDSITVGNDSGLIVIDVDYSRNQITVDQSFTWNNNEDVALDYNGSAPDIGAYESEHILGPEDGYYYVSTTGDDSNNGTSPTQAWKTIQKLNTELNSGGCIETGDNIYFKRGDVFNDYPIQLRKGGSSTNKMIFDAYGTGAKPIIGGHTPSYYHGFQTLDSVGHITIQNLDLNGTDKAIDFTQLQNHNMTIKNVNINDADGVGIAIREVNHFTIENCNIYPQNTGIHAISIVGDGNIFGANGTIINSTCHGCKDGINIHYAGSDENYSVADNIWIDNCTVYNTSEEGIDTVGGSYCNFIYINNTEFRNNGNGAFTPSHAQSDLIVDNCFIRDSVGNLITSGASYQTDTACNRVIIRRSVIKNWSNHAFAKSGGITTISRNLTIYNNDFIANNSVTDFIQLTPYVENVIFKNNIFYSHLESSPSTFVGYDGGATLSGTTSNWSHNLWWRGDGNDETDWWTDGDGSYNFTEWMSKSEVSNELKQNPSMVNPNGNSFPADFKLNSDSPAIDAGDWLTHTVGSGSGTTITIEEANYFFAGFNTIGSYPHIRIPGDKIFIGDDKNLEINFIDYYSNQIIINRSINWINGDIVGLSSYKNLGPDIGAYESEHILGPEDGYYYVSTTGDDDNDGSYENPWETIQKAVDTLTAGETVYIMEGTYNGYNTPWSGASSGTPGNWITYTNYNDDKVILDGTGGTDQCDGLFWFDNQGYIRISGLTFRNSSCNGVRFSCAGGPNTHNITIDNCTFYNCSDAGIYLYPYSGNNGFIEDVLIENNTLCNCQNGWNHEPCAPNEVITIGNVTRFVVRNNYLYQNHKIGIDAKDEVRDGEIYNNRINTTPTGLWNLGGSGVYIDAYDDNARDIKVYKNIVWGNGTGYAIATEQGGTLTDIALYNNIYNGTGNGFQINNHTGVTGSHLKKDCSFINNHIAGDTSICIQLTDRHSSFENFIIRNNILNGNIGINIATHSDLDLSAHNIDHNLFNISGYSHFWGSNAINGSPMFVDPENGDYTLSQGSPAIDNGSSLYAPIKDFNGDQRPQGEAVDIGAYESSYSFDPDNTAPVVSNIPDQTISEGDSFTSINLDDFVSDSEDSDSEISWSCSGNIELDVSIADRIATVSIPDEDWNGQETITFTAADTGMLSDSVVVVFTVNPVNDPPVVSSPSPGDGQGSVSKSLSSISVSISDPEGDSFNWSISTSPDIGSASNTFDDNGSKSVSISGLSYSTEYTWFVSVQEICSGNWSNMSFSFMTEAAPSNDPGPDPDPDDDDDDSGIDDDTSINNPPDRPILNFFKDKIDKMKYLFEILANDSDGDMVRFQFDWGNGSFSSWTDYFSSNTTNLIEHVLEKIGDYNIRVRAQDKNGNYSDWSKIIQLTISSSVKNETEKTVFKSINYTNNVNESIIFNASDLLILDENITSYKWILSNGFVYNTKIFNHTFTKPGKYNLTLIITYKNETTYNQTITFDIIESKTDIQRSLEPKEENKKKKQTNIPIFLLIAAMLTIAIPFLIIVKKKYL